MRGFSLTLLMLMAACRSGLTAEPGPEDVLAPVDGGAADPEQRNAGAASLEGPMAQTDHGAVVGTELDGVRLWRRVPYAAPPVGPLRFRPPEPHQGWDTPRDARVHGPVCAQWDGRAQAIVGAEDCLSLQIFAPDTPGPHPTMVWIHGGGFSLGAGSLELHDGASLVKRGDVVVVSVNYRLGSLGFLATEALVAESATGSAGNYGLRDQVFALQWVQRNIAAFGGDPENVTIFGESAGGASVCALLGAPSTEGLFARAIVQSGGGCYGLRTLDATTEEQPTSVLQRGAEIVATAGCDVRDELSCLRELEAERIVEATWSATPGGLGFPDVGPVLDGEVLLADTWQRFTEGSALDRPVMIGSTADEMRGFLAQLVVPSAEDHALLLRNYWPDQADALLEIYPADAYPSPKLAYETFLSDLAFICPAVAFAELAAAGAAPSYAYHFTHLLSGEHAELGAFHVMDLYFVFDRLDLLPGNYLPGAKDEALVETVQKAWLAFARGEPPWPAYRDSLPFFEHLGPAPTTSERIRAGRCAALQDLGLVPRANTRGEP